MSASVNEINAPYPQGIPILFVGFAHANKGYFAESEKIVMTDTPPFP